MVDLFFLYFVRRELNLVKRLTKFCECQNDSGFDTCKRGDGIFAVSVLKKKIVMEQLLFRPLSVRGVTYCITSGKTG